MLDVPVLVEGEVSGVLSLQHYDTRLWDDDDVSFANTTSLMLALALEAAQRQEAETQIEHLAWYDGLTGLPNRNLLRGNDARSDHDRRESQAAHGCDADRP